MSATFSPRRRIYFFLARVSKQIKSYDSTYGIDLLTITRVKMSAGLLQSTLTSPIVRHVVVTSSIVANLNPSPAPSATVASASTHIPPSSPLPEAYAGRDVGIATKVDHASIFDHVKDQFPEAVKEGIFKKGTVPTLPMEYDSSDAKGLLGELKGFETAVSDVPFQHLQLLEKRQ